MGDFGYFNKWVKDRTVWLKWTWDINWTGYDKDKEKKNGNDKTQDHPTALK